MFVSLIIAGMVMANLLYVYFGHMKMQADILSLHEKMDRQSRLLEELLAMRREPTALPAGK